MVSRIAAARAAITSLRPYGQVLAPTLIEDFESAVGWTDYGASGGTLTADPANKKLGTQSLQWGSTGGAQITKRYKYNAAGVNLSALDRFYLWVYFPAAPPTGTQINLYLSSDAAGTFANYKLITLGGAVTGTFRKGAQLLVFRKADMGGAGSINWSSVKNVMFQLNSPNGATAASLDAFYAGGYARPMIVFTLDDADISQYNAFVSHFQPRGIAGGIYVPGSLIDTTGTTSAQLLAMQDAGWDMCNHTWSHVDVTTLGSQAAIETEVGSNASWMRSKGFNHPEIFAYPNGNLNDTAIAALQAQGIAMARSLMAATGQIASWGQENAPMGVADWHKLNAVAVTEATGSAAILAAVDKAIQFGVSLWLYAHAFTAAGATGTQTNLGTLAAILDGLLARKNQGLCDLVTPSRFREVAA